MSGRSENFTFLAKQNPKLEEIAANAERDWSRDPVGSLMRQRLFAEMVARLCAVRLRIVTTSNDHFNDVLDLLERRSVPAEAIDLFHKLRKRGNEATHRAEGSAQEALSHLRVAHQLAIWLQRSFYDAQFKASAFVTPEDPADTLRRLEARAAAASRAAQEEADAAKAARAEALAARAAAEQSALQHALAEQRAEKEAADRAVWEQLAAEYEKAVHEVPPAPDAQALIQGFLQRSAEAAKKIKVTEADVRRGIDQALRAAGWEADSQTLTWNKGARPAVGVDQAIAEWPTSDGTADYVLFAGLRPVAVVEAKGGNRSALDAITQAERYSRGYVVKADETLTDAPWGAFKVPLVCASNGRAYHRQLETSTGVWVRDVRDPTNKARVLQGWLSPDGIRGLLATNVAAAHAALRASPVEALSLRPYQNEAITAVEAALSRGATRCLVAMATGTGKTRTAIGLVYRLIEAGRFRRVLFVVDRSALGEQTADALRQEKVASGKSFAQIFGIKDLSDTAPDTDTRLHIATVQGLMSRVLDQEGDGVPRVDDYDCLVVDECHRGYTLDREMTETELAHRDPRDYESRYRKVIDYFDAVKIALTATPALHTSQIFGLPIFRYSFARAVLDKMLVPQEPPYRIVTELARDGIHYGVGEVVSRYVPGAPELDTAETPDELQFEVDDFNRQVKVDGFNDAVCAQLAKEIDPHLGDKTLVFCVDDAHATYVTRRLKLAFDAQWGPLDDGLIAKITGSVDRPLEQIRRFRNERAPAIVVTVDLLTTGVDIPRICNVVFLRRVKSRILFEQMLGRATRLCPEIRKESFRVYDAVGQTECIGNLSNMQPTVVSPKFTFRALAQELLTIPDERMREAVLEQFLEKLRRKRAAVDRAAGEDFESAAGMTAQALVAQLASQSPAEAAAWVVEHPDAVGMLDRIGVVDPRVVIHHGEDRVVEVSQDFAGKAPQDYLEAFGEFVQRNLNRIPALMVVKTAPRDLTRRQLTELAEALDVAGFSELSLRTAWRTMTNDDIAAGIVGYVRQRALGEPLVPYAERVDRAVKKVLSAQRWTRPQREWLERIGRQLAVTTVLDRDALDAEPFRDYGGFAHLNTVFDGRADEVLRTLTDAVWQSAG